MKKALTHLSVLLLVAGLSAGSGTAGESSPIGKWQSATGESRYEVTLCDGEQLCARLTWLRSDARTQENLAYLNKYVVRGAKPVATNKWRGTVHYGGEKIGGSVTLVGEDRLRVNSCMLVMCQTMEFNRL